MSALWKDRPSRALRHADPDAAIAGYMERLRQADVSGTPAPPSALNGLGDAYLDKEDVESAIDYYRQAAEAYAQAGLHDNAIACCRKILRYAPESPVARLLLGRTYAAKGLRADALAELESLADRLAGTEDRKAATEVAREVVRLAPKSGERREQLARLLHQDGQRDAAIAEYRAAAVAFEAGGDQRGADRVRHRLAEIEPPTGDAAAGRESGVPARTVPLVQGPRHEPREEPSALEIEHTSYSDQEAARVTGDARALERAADNFRQDRRWPEAVEAYRGLAGIGQATPEHFAAWAECARQTGEPSRVLEALSTAARWHLDRNEVDVARRAAEEMLLIDPRNVTAGEILERIGSRPE